MFSFNNSVFFFYFAVITIFGKCHSETQIVKLATLLIVDLDQHKSSPIKREKVVFWCI